MKFTRLSLFALLVVALLALSGLAVLAQEATDEPGGATQEPEAAQPLFTDNRINAFTPLINMGIYCENEQGIAGATYEGGGIAVWGASGERYLFVAEEVLTCPCVDPDEVSAEATAVVGAEATPEAGGDVPCPCLSQDEDAGDDAQDDETGDPTDPGSQAILLAQGEAPTGLLRFYWLGENQFQLNGVFEDGRDFSYEWTGCEPNPTGLRVSSNVAPEATEEADMEDNDNSGTGSGG
jgi:hypothetical protein